MDAISVDDILHSAQELLAARFGGRQKLSDPEDLGGSGESVVLRFRLATNPFLPERSVVVKQLPTAATTGFEPALLREIVSYQFTNTLPEDTRPGPTLLAHDVEHRLLVLSDIGEAETYDELLAPKTTTDERTQALRALANALARTHTATAMREEGFHALMSRLFHRHHLDPAIAGARDRGVVRSIDKGLKILHSRGIAVTEDVQQLANLAARRTNSGNHRAFTPFDLRPDNILVRNRVFFLDYEWAGFRDVAFDLAAVVAGFPHYPFTEPLSDDEASFFVETWQGAVKHMWPDIIGDDELHERITIALLGWVLLSVTLLHFGGAEDALAAEGYLERRIEHGELSDPGAIYVPPDHRDGVEWTASSAAERKDLIRTAKVLRRFAESCSERFADCVPLADAVVAMVSDHRGS
ncbi:phosphotransferase [Corynebacterium sp. TAE3-ERU12]|uniref:phosphotransferase family protein n=1 Tax=Corynebacterium sp. TAE3-ERU12 TaxID=2849491 RepID=UPI001C4722AB|nr:phosphotransferase [Corynebacterium sp. TAE3-ERU12]MBV7295370.1 phosphotransferase [Corynebacterium sp. TAE3-ERU12]